MKILYFDDEMKEMIANGLVDPSGIEFGDDIDYAEEDYPYDDCIVCETRFIHDFPACLNHCPHHS